MQSKYSSRHLSMAAALLLVGTFFSFVSPQFLSARNLSLLLIELSITATLAMGMLLVIIPGHIDLSAGSGVGLLGGIASVLVFEHSLSAPVAMAMAFVIGLVVWAAMGTLVVRERIPSFIISLGGLLVFKGLFWLVIQNATIPVTIGGQSNLYSLLTTYYFSPRSGYILAALSILLLCYSHLSDRRSPEAPRKSAEEREVSFLKLFLTSQLLILFVLVSNQYRGVPAAALILAAVAFLIHVITTHTPFGRYLYAIGGNEEAALLSGVPVQRVLIFAFTMMGGIVAITGLMQTAYAGASTTTIGELMELDAVAACVIGGVSLKGGKGTVPGVLFGALLMAVLLNGMTLLAVPPEFKFIARGSVLALAVWMDVRFSR